MKRFHWLLTLFLATSVLFFSCDPDDDVVPATFMDHSEWIDLLALSGGGQGNSDLLCYDVVYPISFVLPNGNIIEADNEGQMIGLLNANPSPIEIVFPITLEDEDDNEIIVEDEDELQMYLDLCEDDDWEDIFGDDDDLFDCYEIQFPIQVELSDGTTAAVNDLDELIALFDDEPYPVAPVFPIILLNDAGDEFPVNGLSDLSDLADDCDDDDDEWEPGDLECYELVYPVEILLEDGTTAFANDPDELTQILIGTPAPVDFVYPITLIDEDGNEYPVDDEDDLDDLIDDCEDDDEDELDWDELFDNDCYDLAYPHEVLLSDSTTTTVADEAELIGLLDMDPYPIDLVYPATLLDEDGNEYEVADQYELLDLLDDDDCGDDEVECNHGLMASFFTTLADTNPGNVCYELVYPITLVLTNGNEEPINDLAALEDFLDVPGNFAQIQCAVFPFEINDLDSGDPIVVETPEDIRDLKEDCDD